MLDRIRNFDNCMLHFVFRIFTLVSFPMCVLRQRRRLRLVVALATLIASFAEDDADSDFRFDFDHSHFDFGLRTRRKNRKIEKSKIASEFGVRSDRCELCPLILRTGTQNP